MKAVDMLKNKKEEVFKAVFVPKTEQKPCRQKEAEFPEEAKMVCLQNNILENFARTARQERTKNIPVVFCLSTAYICDLFKIRLIDYYHNVELKLKTQCAFQDKYPEVMLIPGIHPDWSCGAVEPSANGCEIIQTSALHPLCPKARIRNIDDLSHIKEPDPKRDGLLRYRPRKSHAARRRIQPAYRAAV